MDLNRREFIKMAGLTALVGSGSITEVLATPQSYKISLAEWSVHKQIFDYKLDHLDFPKKAKEQFGISIVEYVNTLFISKGKDFKENGKDPNYLRELMKRCNDYGVQNHLIMCDAEGHIGDADKNKRNETVENHLKWLDAAKYLGCKTIRVNAAGKGSEDEVAKNATEGLHTLGERAASMGLNVIVENHGGYSSKGYWLAGVIKNVGLENVGTLPDFGNFCVTRNPDNWKTCTESYDTYKGIKELIPFAKGLSAKTNYFTEDGWEKDKDYKKILKIVRKSNFNGIIGIEYEGDILSEDDGIIASKKLLNRLGVLD